tara:strand:+ start:153 stop:665 length:513 start_codon:yes stop_codon:yes gene_type:complete
MANKKNRWTQPGAPPPPLFVGKAERNFVKQINDELVEKIVGQQVLYYPIDVERTNFHPLYGEAINKTFLPPIRIYALVEYVGSDRVQQKYGFDNLYNINVHSHKRRLVEDQNLFTRLGDFLQYDDMYFEIVDLFEPRYIFGQDSAFTNDETAMEVTLVGKQARRGLFNAD